MLTVTWKQFGAGEERLLIPEYRAGTALFAEIRAILKQVAQELGQWGVKQSQLEIPGTLSVAEILKTGAIGAKRRRQTRWRRSEASGGRSNPSLRSGARSRHPRPLRDHPIVALDEPG